ncbi:ABC transporter ATP-binding protein [Corynebacterium kroppenstedtii]|uniref:ABC transporter ATP-binding protein n=1 Tax=Corynebacterium kroppenstedtii TaxID=161879 RepID=A0A2W5SXQ3_9CORY|nr:ABC transporter ATP-binding protein [Corynebacterium kroppenstedtii]MDU7286938.1 ABC transporter ATP-binding protein [Corynebacterium kroppenstedtii]PZR04396.1 MAG: ABC transporter ATP-binding protein [Corynebacterium kroppenstedtii]
MGALTESTPVTVRHVGFSYGVKGQAPTLSDVTLSDVRVGTVTALVGPNGAGKSTLLRCIAGLEKHEGEVDAERALYLPQDPPPMSSLTVFESVLVARQQSFRGFAGFRVGRVARRDVENTIEMLGLEGLSSRTMAQLSGGQRQLVSFAQAVVRRPAVLLLDEPVSAFDLRNQLMLLGKIRSCAQEIPAAVMMTVHDLGHAARFGDRVVVLSGGSVYAEGTPREVITEHMLREVYGVSATVHATSDGGLAVEASEALW